MGTETKHHNYDLAESGALAWKAGENCYCFIKRSNKQYYGDLSVLGKHPSWPADDNEPVSFPFTRFVYYFNLAGPNSVLHKKVQITMRHNYSGCQPVLDAKKLKALEPHTKKHLDCILMSFILFSFLRALLSGLTSDKLN